MVSWFLLHSWIKQFVFLVLQVIQVFLVLWFFVPGIFWFSGSLYSRYFWFTGSLYSKSDSSGTLCILDISNRLSSTIDWQRRNGPIIHNVTSVKYNKENEIFSHQLAFFPSLNTKNAKTENKEHIHLYHCKINTKIITIYI